MSIIALPFLVGVIAGLRTMTAPAAVSWAAYLGWLPLEGTWLAFLGHPVTAYLFAALALIELVVDQLPSTPSRKVPLQFGGRLVMGTLTGAAIGASAGLLVIGAILGAIGAVAGTLGGAAARARLAAAFGRDRPAALIEDAVAIGGAFLIMLALR
ncbi:MAG: DUF4126 family protein [Rhodospirillaceae bacterium]|nr:DUF4126 family protein [Rhodospirillaceae bacterium]